MNSVNQIHNEVCSLCASPMHTIQMCPAMIGYFEYHSEHVNALNNYGKFASPFSETYNSNWRKHPNFLWRQNQPSTNVGGPPLQSNSQFPPGFHPSTQTYPTQFHQPQTYLTHLLFHKPLLSLLHHSNKSLR